MGKGEIARNEELSAIFIKFEIALSVWKSLGFVVWERVNFTPHGCFDVALCKPFSICHDEKK